MTEGKTLEKPVAKKAPIGVEVENVEPLQVEIAEEAKPTPITTKSGEMSLPPTTTLEQDTVTAGQRRIGLLWEAVQGFISITVTSTTVYVLAMMTLKEGDVTSNQLIAVGQLVVMATLILSSYFSRTNHQTIGGVGRKATDDQPYKGR